MVTYQTDEQNKLLADLRAAEEEALVRNTATIVGLPYRDLTNETINTDALRLIDDATAHKAEMAAFAMVGKKLEVAVKSPSNPAAVAELSRLETMGYETNLSLVSSRSLEKAWARYADLSQTTVSRGGLIDINDENLQHIATEIHSNDDIKKRLDAIFAAKDSHQVSQVLETIFGSAIALGSSDIHFEPEEKFARLRFREDGVLQEITQLDPALYQKLLNRMKFIAGMKLTITETAQDGRFTIFYKEQEMEVRVAVAPGAYNESIVMRILNPEGLAVEFGKLGIEPKLLKILEREIAKPNGMILTTGPTGSGKTTTLYSFLKKVYSPEKKIITIEDPIEYHLPGITQEQVSHEKGFDFLAGLRAALRQDPEIIMVGEIRDKETATIAVNASLTGHMVFSTLHTNNAAGTIPRLLDLGIQPGILTNALTVAIAQRLVRKLCPDCKKQTPLTAEQEDALRGIISHAESIGKDYAAYNIRSDMPLVTYVASESGCATCNQTGYKDRVGLYEVILMDDEMARVTIQDPAPTERDIKRAAEHQKLFTLAEDAVIKIVTGVTSFEEIQSVVDLTEDLQDSGEDLAMNPQRREDLGRDDHDLRPSQSPAASAGSLQEPSRNTFAESSDPEEIILLVDYLKLLEEHQQKNPSVGIADKIARAKEMIVSILQHTPNVELLFAGSNPSAAVRDEISRVKDELAALESEQQKNPQRSVAEELGKIRNTIQSLRTEVAA